jgi:hypothetical protein
VTRPLLAVALSSALIVGWISIPAPSPSEAPPALEPAAAAAAVCPVRLDRIADGKVTIASTMIAPARITVGNVGTVVTDLAVDVGEAGGAAVPFADFGVGGSSGAFVEFGVPAAAAASVSRGMAGVTATSCPTLLRTTSVIAGGSTRNMESLELILSNPYGSDAVVAVESASEIGVDSVDQLAGVVVPARSTVTRDLSTLLPLRNRLSLTISPVRGLVHAFVHGGGRGDRVMIEHVAPGSTWTAPIPAIDGQTVSLVIASISPIEVTVRMDGWFAGQLTEGVVNETIGPRSQIEIPLADLEIDLDVVRVLSDGPVAVSLVSEGEAGRAVSPANVEALPEWLMPGPGSPGSIVWIGVPGEADGVVEFQSLEAGGRSFVVDVTAGELTAVAMDDQPIGYTLRADVPITVLWSVADATGLALAAPTPLPGGE